MITSLCAQGGFRGEGPPLDPVPLRVGLKPEQLIDYTFDYTTYTPTHAYIERGHLEFVAHVW